MYLIIIKFIIMTIIAIQMNKTYNYNIQLIVFVQF